MSEALKLDVVVTGEQPVMLDGVEYQKGAAVTVADCVSIRFLIAIGAIMAGRPASAPPPPDRAAENVLPALPARKGKE